MTKLWLIITLAVLVLFAVFFFPKQDGYAKDSIIGYLREEHKNCFGFTKVVNAGWPIGYITDSGTKYICFGFPHGESVCKARIRGQNLTYEESIVNVPCNSVNAPQLLQ